MYGKFLLIAVAVFFFFLPKPIWNLQVSEVMYNPAGGDSGREWVEIYNNDSTVYNLTGWKLVTSDVDHSLNVPPENGGQGSMVITAGAYLIIAQNATSFLADYPEHNGTVIDSSWSGLTNSANETIWIKNSSIVFDNVTYSIVSEGKSFCRVYGECNATPGTANAVSGGVNATNVPDISLSILISNASVNSTYTSLFIIEISNKSCSYPDNVTVSYNISMSLADSFTREVFCSVNETTGSWTPQVSGNYTICGVIQNSTSSDTNLSNNAACKFVEVKDVKKQCNTSISVESEPVVNVTTVSYKLALSDSLCNETSVDVEYWIEDLFGSYVKQKLNTTQGFSCSKSVDRQWTPDAIVGSEAYKIRAVLNSSCDADTSDNSVEKIIIVRGQQSAAISSDGNPVSTSSTASAIAVSNKKLDIISYPMKVFVDDPFEIAVNVSMNSSFSVYSYVYSGNTPVSVSLDGKGSWDANRKNFSNSGVVILHKKIENGTVPGTYTMKVKVKGEKEYETTKQLEVVARPKLDISHTNNSLTVSTQCEDCDVLLLGEGFEKAFRNSYILERPGIFYALLLRDSKIFSKETINLTKETSQSKSVSGITGLTTARKGNKSILILYALLLMFGKTS